MIGHHARPIFYLSTRTLEYTTRDIELYIQILSIYLSRSIRYSEFRALHDSVAEKLGLPAAFPVAKVKLTLTLSILSVH